MIAKKNNNLCINKATFEVINENESDSYLGVDYASNNKNKFNLTV